MTGDRLGQSVRRGEARALTRVAPVCGKALGRDRGRESEIFSAWRCPPATPSRLAGEDSDRKDRPGTPAWGRSEPSEEVTTSAGRIPAGRVRSFLTLAADRSREISGAPVVRPMGRPARVVPSAPLRSANRDVRTAARTPRLPGPTRDPGRPPDTPELGQSPRNIEEFQQREVGRGWDAKAADARHGPPGLVRTPPAAAVRPLPGIRRQAPRRGYALDGRRRAR